MDKKWSYWGYAMAPNTKERSKNGTIESSREPACSNADEIRDFKDWYDETWLGDNDSCQFIPLPSDSGYTEYMDGYRIGLGAWMARAKKH